MSVTHTAKARAAVPQGVVEKPRRGPRGYYAPNRGPNVPNHRFSIEDVELDLEDHFFAYIVERNPPSNLSAAALDEEV